jgi:hypothetical protein
VKDAVELLVCRSLLARALSVVEEVELPDRSSATIAALALAIIQIARTSPQDQAEQIAVIAAMMRD